MKKISNNLILGTKISTTDEDQAVDVIFRHVKSKINGFVCVAAVHLVMEAYFDKKLKREINKSLLTTPDGMPLVWLCRAKGHKDTQRVYGPDLMKQVCAMAESNKVKVFLVGGADGQGKELEKALLAKYPLLRIGGCCDTPKKKITSEDNLIIIKQIRDSQANIVFVGLGCPFQEKWMIENYQKFKGVVCVGVGAAFDFLTGKTRQAPKWVQKSGLEWLWRLVHDPKRLWYRYLVLNSLFVFYLLLDLFRSKDEKTKAVVS